mmetsp:Transcript_41637/g.129537  ORF Transcript_41637/g.129537 Transcript_41637/m.129537 type:complete len:963 (+) Transcript_41637:53-2941(+)
MDGRQRMQVEGSPSQAMRPRTNVRQWIHADSERSERQEEDDDQDAGNEVSGGAKSGSEESSSGSSTGSRSAPQRRSIILELLKGRFNNFNLADLHGLPIMFFLGTWHTMAIWVAACVLICEVLQKLLKGYVQWMEVVMRPDTAGVANQDFKLFVAVLLRSWFTVVCYSDLTRFCFWLTRDAWRPDAFEAYRRAVVGLGEVEMRSGMLHLDERGMPRGWPEKLTRSQRYVDICMQVLIYASFDVCPVIAAMGVKPVTLESVLSTMTSYGALAGVVHVFIWKLAWTYTDLRMKYVGFREAWACGHQYFEACSGETEEDDEDGLAVRVGMKKPEVTGKLMRYHTGINEIAAQSMALTDEEADLMRRRLKVANSQNICVKLCFFGNLIGPHIAWIGMLVFGIYFYASRGAAGIPVILFGAAVGVYWIGTGVLAIVRTRGSLPTADRLFSCLKGNRRLAKRVWALQAWGEECCGLEYDVQLRRRMTFVTMVSFQTVLFFAMDWRFYAGFCALLVILQLWQLTVHCQVPWGWLVSLVEAGLTFLITTLLSSFYLIKRKQAFETVMFILAHQCGLARKTYHGSMGLKVVRLTLTFLFGAVFLTVAVTTLSVKSQLDPADEYSMLCKNCTYYKIPFIPRTEATGLACPAWFHLGNRNVQLSLSDFGLFSAIAYESESTIGHALALFYPGWKLVFSKRGRDDNTNDWTTFFEFRSPEGSTTIFVVRGTSTALDALNDMVIWMPATVMQAFNGLGPDMLAPVAIAISWMSKVFGRLDNENYAVLQSHVIETMKKEPRREYYIAGHSLGGGLAKIVALRALVEGLQLPAVTFMSPGLLATQYMVEGQRKVVKEEDGSDGKSKLTSAYLRDNELTVTVMPENDIVSRIDTQSGQVVPISCPEGNPLACHLMGTGLCQIFSECGSGRKGQDLNVPCTLCNHLECKEKEGIYQEDFPTRPRRRRRKRRRGWRKVPP